MVPIHHPSFPKMKKTILFVLFISMVFGLSAQEKTYTPESLMASEEIFESPDIPALFPGCADLDQNSYERYSCAAALLHDFIYDNLQYPLAAWQKRTQGIVTVKFVIEKNGRISGCKIMSDIGSDCGKEAIRIAQAMPNWVPAEKQGAKVRSEGYIAVRFKIKDGAMYKPPFVAPRKNTNAPPAPISNPSESNQNSTAQPPVATEDPIYKVVQVQPAFPGCENETDPSKKKICAEALILRFIYSNIKYPAEARASKIEGTVYIKYVVEKDGTITDAELVRDIGGGCGAEALRVVNMMPKWEPGMLNGNPVRVQFNLPVKFELP